MYFLHKKIVLFVNKLLYPPKWYLKTDPQKPDLYRGYHSTDLGEHGPYSWKELKNIVYDKKIGPEDLIRSKKEWIKAKHVKGLFDKPSIITSFIENYRAVISIIAIAFVLSVGSYFAFVNIEAQDVPEVIEEKKGDSVNILPAEERLIGETEVGFLKDPFEAPLVLIGVLQSGNGEHIAALRSGNMVFYVQEKDFIASTWKIEEIHLDRVFLSSEDREIMLKMN